MMFQSPRKLLLGVTFIVLLLIGLFVYFDKNRIEDKDLTLVPIGTSTAPNLATYKDLIRVFTPKIGEEVSSPILITGEARGVWYFEASFPVYVTDWDGKIIGQGIATAQEDWMTEKYVPFKATINFDVKEISGNYSKKGTLIFKKDNPSGLPEHDDAYEMPIFLK